MLRFQLFTAAIVITSACSATPQKSTSPAQTPATEPSTSPTNPSSAISTADAGHNADVTTSQPDAGRDAGATTSQPDADDRDEFVIRELTGDEQGGREDGVWRPRNGISCDRYKWKRYGDNPAKSLPKSESDPWPLEVLRPVIYARDPGGEFFFHRCHTGDGDQCDGLSADAVRVTRTTDSGWKEVWASPMHASSYSTCKGSCNTGITVGNAEIIDFDGDERVEFFFKRTNDDPAVVTAVLVEPDGSRVEATIEADLLNPENDDGFRGCVSANERPSSCDTPDSVDFASFGPEGKSAAGSDLAPQLQQFLITRLCE